jgi:hypothetical protein
MAEILHVVLLQPKTTASETELHAALAQVRALQGVVPGILSLSAGPNLSKFHQGFTYGIIMRFVDKAHLDAHHPHPAHVAAVEALDRICTRIIDLDLPG